MRIRYAGELAPAPTPSRKDNTVQLTSPTTIINAAPVKPARPAEPKPMAKPMTGFESPGTKMMVALMQTGKHIFEGVVTDEEKAVNGGRGVTAAQVARNRKRNKAARRARVTARRAAGR